ncbi:MAG: ATP-dependent DNA helicase [Pseudomonadota bacterium]|nr:ATP-dependent DNA helicase [Pseudomonadota bacterium]
MDQIADILGPSGLLSQRLEGYNHRPQQQAMADAVAAVLHRGGTLICEAGTGTGKTFAYLVPALLSGRKVLVSTGTRNLQDQLFHRDLPVVREVLKVPVRIALLKGRANYLCRYRLDNALQDHRRSLPEQRSQLLAVRDWAAVTRSGDVAELVLPEDAPVWPAVTSSSDNCLGQNCPEWSRCHLVEARRRAQEADLVVINHHLLCADLSLKDEGFGEILPGADCCVVDEAHQLPDVAGSFFGIAVSGRQLLDLTRDLEAEYRRDAGDAPELIERAAGLRRSVQDLRLSFGEESRRAPWREIAAGAAAQALDLVRSRLVALNAGLKMLEGRSKGLDSCLARGTDLGERLDLLVDGGESDDIRWFETHGKGFRLHQTPLQVADIFQSHMERHPAAWIFTSATLAVGESFEHFARQLGIGEARTERWESPFDYPHQALWFVPRGMPEPSSPAYVRVVAELAARILGYSRGRAFLLFTSHRALKEAADYLEPRLDYPLLVQGSAPRAELLERFRRLGNAVLLGTASFWEGVDVRGEALSCVIIDKLPFASPGDPVLAARIDALRQRGGNPFRDFQLPQAVIALKQGAGRLIRDARDRGVLVVCDPRLLSRSYGHAFLDSLPPMGHTRNPADVEKFFALESQ